MKMFPGFPVLFPACSQSFPGESVRSRCSAFPAVTHMDVVPSISNYIQQPGTLRTLGTGLKRNDFGFGRAGTRLGTPGTNWQKARGDAANSGCFHRLINAFASVAELTRTSAWTT